MNFHILTLFPEMVENGLNTSITGRAVSKGLLSIDAVNIRDYAFNKHNSVDDYPYGGGAGMLMQAEPVYLAYEAVKEKIAVRKAAVEGAGIINSCGEPGSVETDAEAVNLCETQENTETATESTISADVEQEQCGYSEMELQIFGEETETNEAGMMNQNPAAEDKGRPLRVVYLSPQGATFSQSMAEELAQEKDLVLLCGHYEGIDERVLEEIVTDYVSIGDYVLTGGELPAMVMVDTISRLVPGVLHNNVSAEFESFQDNLLEYPQYSRPEEWHGKKVPPILLSGHHANIEKWRREQSILRTYERRPDLLEESNLTEKEKRWLEEQIRKFEEE